MNTVKKIIAVYIVVSVVLAIIALYWIYMYYDGTNNVIYTEKFVGSEDNYWITNETTFRFEATDVGSGIKGTYYRIWNNNTWTNWITYDGNAFTLAQYDSGLFHMEFYSEDMSGNKEEVHNQSHYLDSIPPETVKIVTNPLGNETIYCREIIISDEYTNTIYCGTIILEDV